MNLLVSLMRTVVPLLVGWVLSAAQVLGVEAGGGAALALTAAYYALLRAIEEAAERLGWQPLRMAAGAALGWARRPWYPGRGAATITLDMRGGEDELLRILRRSREDDVDRP